MQMAPALCVSAQCKEPHIHCICCSRGNIVLCFSTLINFFQNGGSAKAPPTPRTLLFQTNVQFPGILVLCGMQPESALEMEQGCPVKEPGEQRNNTGWRTWVCRVRVGGGAGGRLAGLINGFKARGPGPAETPRG